MQPLLPDDDEDGGGDRGDDGDPGAREWLRGEIRRAVGERDGRGEDRRAGRDRVGDWSLAGRTAPAASGVSPVLF